MGIRRGSISTPIIADGLVFNMDPANRASTIPSTSTLKTFNTVNPSISGSIITDGQVDTSTITPSFAFDGTDGYINTNDTFLPDFVSAFCWVKSTNSSWPRSLILRQDIPYSRNPFVLHWNGGSVYASVRLQSTSDAYNGVASDTSTYSGVNNGAWRYVGLTFDGPSLKLYVDAELEDTKLTSSVTNGVNGPLWPQSNINTGVDTKTIKIGATNNVSSFFNGNIGSVHIYNRALSSTEILHNYNALKSRFE
jgi:hypothetical protein